MTEYEELDEESEELDDEFPLGDGAVEMSAIVRCPHCGEPNDIALDPGSGSRQEYVEDCQVCCRPWLMYVTYDRQGRADVELYASDS